MRRIPSPCQDKYFAPGPLHSLCKPVAIHYTTIYRPNYLDEDNDPLYIALVFDNQPLSAAFPGIGSHALANAEASVMARQRSHAGWMRPSAGMPAQEARRQCGWRDSPMSYGIRGEDIFWTAVHLQDMLRSSI